MRWVPAHFDREHGDVLQADASAAVGEDADSFPDVPPASGREDSGSSGESGAGEAGAGEAGADEREDQ